MALELVIFDWDGTLLDSLSYIVECTQDAAKAMDLPVPDAQLIKQCTGLGLRTAVSKFGIVDDEIYDQFVADYRARYFGGYADNTQLFTGATQLLDTLAAAKYRLAVATAKSRKGLDGCLELRDLGSYFETTRTAEETASKPDPQMLHEILAETGVNPNNAVMIGDTEYDIRMGQNAGMQTIAVTYGAHSKDHLSTIEPSIMVGSISELEQAILDL